ncbi:MAG: DnaA regulatory inactivator Hda [Gallionella sp.]|nr:DnaA regulatory inactivator Hda [Gallionella sp.]
MSQLLLAITPEHQPTLDNFVIGHNLELLTALRQALSDSGERFFYLWGEVGSGKSHLLQAFIQAASEAHHSTAYELGNVPSIAEVVAMDDVEQLDDVAQIELFNHYNQLRDNGGILLVSGNVSPLHLKLRDDLRTRLGWGLVYQVHSLNDEEKALALAQHAHAKGYALSPEVTQYLLRHGRRDLPSLIAVLDALDEHSLSLHRPLTVPLLKQIMQTELE